MRPWGGAQEWEKSPGAQPDEFNRSINHGRGAQEWEKSLGAQPVQHAMSILGIARHVAGGGGGLSVKELADLVEQVDGAQGVVALLQEPIKVPPPHTPPPTHPPGPCEPRA